VNAGQIPLFGGPPAQEPPPPEPSAPQPAAALTPEPTPEPGRAPESALPVAELNERVRRLVEGAVGWLWVGGEISNWRPHRSGHCYFSLRDDTAQISCVIWRSDLSRLPAHPEEGMKVAAFGQPTVYGARGSYQLVVRELRAEGEGLWRLAFEKLRAKLAAEGLLDPKRKRALPRVPGRIGIVTSRSGAALRDVLTVVRRRAPWARLLISDCRVQGTGAGASIAAAVDRLVRHGGCDVLILTRGGGSVEDLWAFNEEVVARAIASCPIPTVSAVGHEIDITIADLVADVRAATPSAAGETVVPDTDVLLGELRARAGTLIDKLRRRTRRGRERARIAAGGLDTGVHGALRQRRDRTARASGRLDALSPLGTLARGYAVPLDEEARVKRNIGMFDIGEVFNLRVVDGRLRCRTESKQASHE